MKQKRGSVTMDLLHEPVGSTLLRFSLPFMLSTLLQTLYSTTDTVIVGQYLGSAGLSAVSNGSQLMQLLYMLCIGFSAAGQVLIAQAEGAGAHDKTKRVIGTLFVLELILSLVIGAACVLFSRQLLTLLKTPEEALTQARYYTAICGTGMIFTGLYNMLSAVLRGMGDSRHPLLFVFIASLCNVVLDIVFITVFDWNVAGTALATVIGQAVSVVFSFFFLKKHAQQLRFGTDLKALAPDRATAGKLLKLGVPIAIQGGAVQFSFLFVNRMVNSLGLTVSAAFGVAQKLRNLPGILTQGLQMGAASIMGQNWGAQKLDRVSSTVKWCILFSTLICISFGLVFYFFPELCFRAFTQDETVLAFAGLCMFSLVVELPAKCFMTGCGFLVNAQGFVQFSFIMAFVDAFAGRILFCWLLGTVMNMGALGFFLGYSAGTYLTAIPQLIYYVSGLWKRRNVLV